MTERTDLPQLATRREAAEALRVSVRTVDRMINAGQVVVVHPTPRAVRITRDSLHALLAPNLSDPASSPQGVAPVVVPAVPQAAGTTTPDEAGEVLMLTTATRTPAPRPNAPISRPSTLILSSYEDER